MRSGYLLTLSAIALILSAPAGSVARAGSRTEELRTFWAETPVHVDGQMTEWAGDRTAYVEGSGVLLGLSNDGQNLYLLLRFSDPSWAQAIRMRGLTLWLDNTGKKKKDFGIRYFGGPSLSEMHRGKMPGAEDSGDRSAPEERQVPPEMQMPAADQMTVIDKKADHETDDISADGSSGPAAGFGTVDGTYTYEFSIPLKAGDASHFGFGVEPGQAVCLGLDWASLPAGGSEHARRGGDGEHRGKRPGGMGGGRPRGGNGGPGGHGPGDGRGGPGVERPEKQEIWVKTALAAPPPAK